MASRPTTPVNPPPLAPTTPIRSRALSPPSKSPIATPPPPSPIPYLPWRDQITWDHVNPHSAPIVDNFDDEWDVKTLVPKTPERKILLSKERQEIVRKRLQAGHGTHRVHWIVNDDYRADIHGNKVPDSHMILVTGDPRRNGGILSFDGVDVEEGMVVEKRDGLWGVYEAEWDEEYDEEEEGEIPMEQQIYQVFLEGAGGDHEEAWDVYERFRAHKERQAQKERVYQAMLEELEGNEALAREVHALWCEQEEQQRENSEDEHEEQRVDDEVDVFARATMWAKGFRMGYALRDSSFQNTVPSDVPEDSNQSIESTQEPDVYDCLDQWATRFDGQKSKGNSHSLQKDPKKTATSDICKGNDRLIDLEQGPDVYECLGEWAKSFEHGTKEASFFHKATKSVYRGRSELIDIAIETPAVYGSLGLWAQQFEDIPDGNSPTKECLPEAVKTTLTGTTDLTDVFDDGNVSNEITPVTTPNVQPYAGCISCPDAIIMTPDYAATRLKTPEDFFHYRRHSWTNFEGQCRKVERMQGEASMQRGRIQPRRQVLTAGDISPLSHNLTKASHESNQKTISQKIQPPPAIQDGL